ncbi:hypothetical protein [Saccharopolyspora phatthalungensis]|uniref:Uncharacterized protein n=1 Tax=Saccharopolyspora phatthalungensis TaxID=664693 RepID=A0A840QIP0_9PSEU|nr:hypothetical protein [Saccharopolyspora phatthalungensis]MBB5155984.1 hypothetical protein [Saccharopolyspora phatthalungensis]MBB5157283.1 hypothetical protein [Saccharopolyspora phatthalungensis]MBB5157476.1 hypothetical protein [Saccharopolyspora phatthalungensis]MBB5158247.1 hypothetical protein [Saccharopolyspora phatthalungensis]MBB5159711.1 hypothetical protein [Saccharopolyspora phatthalungensis]
MPQLWIGDEPPDDLSVADPAEGPSRSHLLELLGVCADFLGTASPAVHHELRVFLIARGDHAIAGLPAFLDQLALTAAAQPRP